MKVNGRKVKIDAILDDVSKETFLNEEVAGVLGLKEPFQKVQVSVLNDKVDTFQSICRWRLNLKASMGSSQKKSAWKRARSRKSQEITELWIGPNIRINGLTWPSTAFQSPLTTFSLAWRRDGESWRLRLLKPPLFIRVNDGGEKSRTLFHKCGEDGSKNVFLPLTVYQNGHQKAGDLKVDDRVLEIQPDSPRGRWPLGRVT